MLAQTPSATPPVPDDAVGVDTSGGVRFVAVPGSGLEETFPRPGVKIVGGTALPASASPSTLSPPLASNFGGVEDGGVTRATTAAASTQAPELKMSDWVNARTRRARTASSNTNGRSHSTSFSRGKPPAPASSSASASITAVALPPPAWEPEVFLNTGENAAAEAEAAQTWSKEDEMALRGRIRDTITKIEDLSGGLQGSGGREREGDDGGGGGAEAQGRGNGPGPIPAGAGRKKRNNHRGGAVNQAGGVEGSIKNLHESLHLSMELVATGEKHASANTTTIADMSEWLSHLEQKQLINISQEEAMEGTTMAGVILDEGLAVGDCIRDYSDQTSSAFKRLASIFKTACAETERSTKELVARLTEDPTGEEGAGPKEGGGGGTGAGAGKEAGSTAGNVPSAESVIKAKKVERIKIMQEKQLQEAAKTNEEAQGVINQLKVSLRQLEHRFKQTESMNTIVTTNRRKDNMKWNALVLEYEMKINYLERALAQEESKLRIAEQVHREEGLELHLELVSKQRGSTRAGTKTAAMQEEMAALCSKLSATNARLVIAENAKAKLEQEIASEKEKYRKLKEQRAAQGKETLEEHEEEIKSHAKLYDKKIREIEMEHEKQLVVWRKQLDDLRESKEEETGKSAFEISRLKADLEIAHQKGKAAGGEERVSAAQAKLDALREEQERVTAEAKYEKEAAEEVLQDTIKTYKEKLKEADRLKKQSDERVAELEPEVERLAARCKELVQQKDITSEERARIENALRQQHRLADEQRVQETANRLAGLEQEQHNLLSRVLEAEAEADRQRRAVEDLVLVLEQAKSAQLALKAAAATQRAEDAVRESSPEPGVDTTEAEKAAREKAAGLQEELSKANIRVEGLQRELTRAEQSAKEATHEQKRAREAIERAALAEEQARAAAEAAKAAAASGPSEHQQDMFQVEAILKAEVRDLEERVRTAESEADLLHHDLMDAEQNIEELEEEVGALAESRAKMRVEVHEAHCQIQRMTVERASLRRQGVDTANLLSKTEALLREVTGCIDQKENMATYTRVAELLAAIRKRKIDERAVKMNRARDRIEAENRARIEKALNALRLRSQDSVAGRLERAPAHLRGILAVFLDPSFQNSFLDYARRYARGEVVLPSALDKQATSSANTLTSSSKESEKTAGGGGGNPPPRRAISLDYPETCPGHGPTTPAAAAAAASVPALAKGLEKRRQVMFGELPPTKSEANMIAAGKHRSSITAPGGRNGSGKGGDAVGRVGDGVRRNQQTGKRKSRNRRKRSVDEGKTNPGTQWRRHREGSDFSMTLTAESAVGRSGRTPSKGGGEGGAPLVPEQGSETAATARAAAAAAAAALEEINVRVGQLGAQRKDLEERERQLQEDLRLEEDAQRELGAMSDGVEAEAAKIDRPGPEKDRLEEELRAVISKVEAGAARLEELSQLSSAATAARKEAEDAYASAVAEEAEAVSDTKAAMSAEGALASGSTSARSGGSSDSTNLAVATASPETAGEASENAPEGRTITKEELAAEPSPPPRGGATSAAATDGPVQEKRQDGVLDSKRPAASRPASDAKRRRTSSSGGGSSSRASSRRNHGDSTTPLGGTKADGGTVNGEAIVPTTVGTAAATAAESLTLHPVFAHMERKATSAEASIAAAASVVEMTLEAEALAKKLSACEGKLEAAAAAEAPATKTHRSSTASSSGTPNPAEIEATKELEGLMEAKSEAAKKLAGTSIESILTAVKLLRKKRNELNKDDRKGIEANEATENALERNLASADMVEVSVALAEAALHKREGAALLKHHQRRKRQQGDHRRLRSEKNLGNASSPPGNTPATTDTADEEIVDRCWNDEKAAETERRLAILSKSLEASDIHDLQVLRKSLQRELDDAGRSLRESKPSRSRVETTSAGEGKEYAYSSTAGEEPAAAAASAAETADEDERWKAEVLAQRLDAVERAVERKGGWRSAVFLHKNGGEVNVDVDVEPWPAADGVLMLQTVRDALHVQLMESRSKVEELEDMAALVPSSEGLEGHLEAAADLHRAVTLLWEGVGDVLKSSAEARTAEPPAEPLSSQALTTMMQAQDKPRPTASDVSDTSVIDSAIASTANSAGENDPILMMLQDEEFLEIPMHLEDLPLPIVTNALSVDIDRVTATTKYVVAGLLRELSAAAAAAAAAAASSKHSADEAHQRRGTLPQDPPNPVAPPSADKASLPAATVPLGTASPQELPPDDDIWSSKSVQEELSEPASERVSVAGSEAEIEETPSTDDAGVNNDPGLQAEDDASTSTTRTATSEGQEDTTTSPALPPKPIPEDDASDHEERVTQAEVDEAWERAREMEETARGLRDVVEERGGVIDLLQREITDLKTALATADSGSSPSNTVETPFADPHLEQELQKAMVALGEERAFLADTTQKLDTSLEERDRLLDEVAEAKMKERQLQTMLDEVCERENQLVAQMTELQQLKAAEGAALEQLDAQIEEDSGMDEPELEQLRVKRRQKVKKIADANARLVVALSQHENMWERAMKSYKWVHHLPQISVKNRQYASVQEWIEAEIADQRRERKKLERAARLRLKRLQPRSLMHSHQDQSSLSTGGLAPVLVTSLSGNVGNSSRPKVTAAGLSGGSYGYGDDRVSFGAPASLGHQRNLKGSQRTEAIAGANGAELLSSLLRGGEMPSTPLNFRAARESEKNHPRNRLHEHHHRPTPGYTGSASPSSPAFSITSPGTERGSSRQATPTLDGHAGGHGGMGAFKAGFDVTNSVNSGRTSRMAKEAENQRYKSLFTNAPAELPEVTVMPAGGGDDNNLRVGGTNARDRSISTSRAASREDMKVKAGGGNDGMVAPNQPTNYRRAQTAKVDYHNSVRRKSSNTSFTHPVGHPGGLNTLAPSQSGVESLKGWGEGQPVVVAAAGRGDSSGTRGLARPVSVAGGSAATTGPHEEPFRWIPGEAHKNKPPVVRSHSRGSTANPSARLPTSNSSAGETEASATRLPQPRRTANSGRSRGSAGGNGSPTEYVLDDNRGTASGKLPRQLAVPGSWVLTEAAGAGGAAGSNHDAGLHGLQGRRGGGSRQPGGARGGRAGAVTETNNLHPAWRPKGLTRRQRAVSVVERG